jgi:hypothetical protein
MLLNRIEKTLMNNPVRAMLQRHYEARLLERLGGRVDGLRVLGIGCGRGVGTEIIFESFRARELHAFDLDPDIQSKILLCAEFAPRYNVGCSIEFYELVKAKLHKSGGCYILPLIYRRRPDHPAPL